MQIQAEMERNSKNTRFPGAVHLLKISDGGRPWPVL